MRFIVALATVMICISGCGPAEQEKFEATAKLLSAWDKDIKSSRADYIRVLISEGANINARSTAGMTPLMIAAGNSSTPEIVQLLLEKGAEVNARSTTGKTPLMRAARNTNGKSAEIKQLLINAGAKE